MRRSSCVPSYAYPRLATLDQAKLRMYLENFNDNSNHRNRTSQAMGSSRSC